MRVESRRLRRDRVIALVAALGVIAISAAPATVQAHGRSVSYSSWTLRDDGATVRVRIALLELSRLDLAPVGVPDSQRVVAYLVERLALYGGGQPCPVTRGPLVLSAAEGWASYEWEVSCSAPGERVLQSSVLLDVVPGHLHFARLRGPWSEARERVFTEASPSWRIVGEDPSDEADSRGTSIGGYLLLGIEHILSGWDHLAFVMALLLLAGGLGEVARLVTGFTVAHSVTLGLAVLGVLHPQREAVEALIGFSIALVAAENAWLLSGRGRGIPVLTVAGLVLVGIFGGHVPRLALLGLALFSLCHFALLARVQRPERLRVAVAFAFGLVHGFGFAGVLGEMALPSGRLVPALFGFNVGVELGQLAVVALAWPLLRLAARYSPRRIHVWITEFGSAAICGLGLFWFVTRLYGA